MFAIVVMAGKWGAFVAIDDGRARTAAHRVFVDLHLVVPGGMAVAEAHAICDRIEEALEVRYPGGLFTIHTEPEGEVHGDGGVLPTS